MFAKKSLVTRNITVAGRRTSVRLEPDMWDALCEVSQRESHSIHELCTLIQNMKVEDSSLTTAIRTFLINYYRAAATNHGHLLAGHGYQEPWNHDDKPKPQTKHSDFFTHHDGTIIFN